MEPIRVQLRVRSSHLHVGRGPAGQVFRTAEETRYLIGSADDAFLCCRHPALQPHHCWIIVHEQKGVFAQAADAPIAINSKTVTAAAQLNPGDLLTVGPLQFEVSFQQTALDRSTESTTRVDPVEKEISDWLTDQDEHERRRRLKDKVSREYQLDQVAPSPPAENGTKAASGPVKPQLPQRQRKPGKLPPRKPQGPASPTSDAAAEGALKRIFSQWGADKKKDEKE